MTYPLFILMLKEKNCILVFGS